VSRGTAEFLVFDLDGTLIDGYDAIADALGFAMESFGEKALPLGRVREMVGHGLEVLLEEAVGRERAAEGVRLFRERYAQVAVAKTRLMPDVPEVLETLAARGHPMAVASHKPARFSRLILEACGVAKYFLAIAGPDAGTPAKPDPAMLRELMSVAGMEPAQTVVVGDTEVDSALGRAAGCRVVLVPGGSRSLEELKTVSADALLSRFGELPRWLAGKLSPGAIQSGS